MKEKSLEVLSKEELQRKVSVLTGAILGLSIMLVVLIIASVYVVFGQGQTKMMALLVIPLALFPVVLLIVSQMKKVKAELGSRE